MKHIDVPNEYINKINALYDNDVFFKEIVKTISNNNISCKNIYELKEIIQSNNKNTVYYNKLFVFLDNEKTITNRYVLFELLSMFSIQKKLTAQTIINEIKSFYDKEISNETELYLWNLSDLLYVLNQKSFVNDYIEILMHKEYGTCRQMIALLLGKIKNNISINILLLSLNDPSINGHALDSLYKMRVKGDYYINFLSDERLWVKKIAKKIQLRQGDGSLS